MSLGSAKIKQHYSLFVLFGCSEAVVGKGGKEKEEVSGLRKRGKE